MTWVHGDAATIVVPDRALHAGMLADCVFGNLKHAYDQSGYDYCAYHHSTTPGRTVTKTATWEWMTEWQPIAMPIRRQAGGAWRTYDFSIEGSISTGTATIRAYMVQNTTRPPLGTAGSFLEDETAYVELEFTTNSYTVKSGIITLDLWSHIIAADAAPVDAPSRLDHPVAWLDICCQVSTAPAWLALRGPRLREIAA